MNRWVVKLQFCWPWFFALNATLCALHETYWLAAGNLCMGINSATMLYDFSWRDDPRQANRIMAGLWFLGALLMLTPSLKQVLS
jgi:hypothetical protein